MNWTKPLPYSLLRPSISLHFLSFLHFSNKRVYLSYPFISIIVKYFITLASKFHEAILRHFLSPKLPRPLSYFHLRLNSLATTFNHPFNKPFNQGWHLTTPPCINTLACLQINQYWTGLRCISYSVTQVKTQLHKIT